MIIKKLEFYTHENEQFIETELDSIIFYTDKINVILSDTTADSGNGVGKTLALEIIDYCLGSSINFDGLSKLKNIPEFSDIIFSITIQLSNISYKIYRSFQEKSRSHIYIIENDFSLFPIRPQYDKKLQLYKFSLDEWKYILNHVCFSKDSKHGFRELLYLYIKHTRAEYNKTTHEYILSSSSKNKKNFLTHLMYVLSNDPSIKEPIDIYKESFTIKTILEQNHKITGLSYFESAKWLEKIKCKSTIYDKDRDKNLKLVDSFNNELASLSSTTDNDLKKQLDSLTSDISNLYSELNNKNIELTTLNNIISKIEEENKISPNEIKNIYETIDMMFSGVVLETLDSVYNFHQKIHDERVSQYQIDLKKIKKDMKDINNNIKTLTLEREKLYKELYQTDIMGVLRRIDDKKNEILLKLSEIEHKTNELSYFYNRIEEINKQDVDFSDFSNKFSSYMLNLCKYFDDMIRNIYPDSDISYPFIRYNINENTFELITNSGTGKNEMSFVLFDWIRNAVSEHSINFKLQIHDSNLLSDIDHPALTKYFQWVNTVMKEKRFQYIISLSKDEIDCLESTDYVVVKKLSKDNKLLKYNF